MAKKRILAIVFVTLGIGYLLITGLWTGISWIDWILSALLIANGIVAWIADLVAKKNLADEAAAEAEYATSTESNE